MPDDRARRFLAFRIEPEGPDRGCQRGGFGLKRGYGGVGLLEDSRVLLRGAVKLVGGVGNLADAGRGFRGGRDDLPDAVGDILNAGDVDAVRDFVA